MEHRRLEMTPQFFENAVLPEIKDGGTFVLTVTGSSMAPTLRSGTDAVLLEEADTVKAGDILLFRRQSGEFILHRCIAIGKGRLTMNGDAQSWTEQIEPAQVRAKATKRFRGGKWQTLSPLWGRFWPLTRPFRPALLKLKAKLR